MAQANAYLKMDENTKVNIKMTKNMDKVYLHGLTVKFMKEVGKMEGNMDVQNLQMNMVNQGKLCGIMVNV